MSLTRQWRRIAGGIAFVAAVAWLATRGPCGAESAEVEIRFELGERAGDVRFIRAELHPGDDTSMLAYWEGRYEPGGRGPVHHWPLRADAGVYRLEIEVRTETARARVTRRIELRDGATITVDLSGDLPAAR
jgi:hypothetical protein